MIFKSKSLCQLSPFKLTREVYLSREEQDVVIGTRETVNALLPFNSLVHPRPTSSNSEPHNNIIIIPTRCELKSQRSQQLNPGLCLKLLCLSNNRNGIYNWRSIELSLMGPHVLLAQILHSSTRRQKSPQSHQNKWERTEIYSWHHTFDLIPPWVEK